MSPWLTELGKLLGFSAPLIWATAVFGIFYWADRKASGPAKTAMTAWLQGNKRIDTSNIVIELFDRIYTWPLLSVQAFTRSALITAAFCVVIWFEQGMFARWLTMPEQYSKMVWPSVYLAFGFNILGDYLSLFAVRYWLVIAKRNPFTSLLIGPVIGALIIFVLYITRLATVFTIYDVVYFKSGQPSSLWESAWAVLGQAHVDRSLYPAFVVHLWLPLLALATLGAQAITWFGKAAKKMQWFLKQGQHHPFEAVGCIGAAIVLVIGAAFQWVPTLISVLGRALS